MKACLHLITSAAFFISVQICQAQDNAVNIGIMYIKMGTIVAAEGNFTNSVTGNTENCGDFYLKGNWVNTGTYTTNTGSLYLRGSNPQSVGGTTESDFYILDIDKPSNSVTLNYDTKVSSSMVLTNGAVDLNGKTLTISNTATDAIVKTNGYLISEQTDHSSKVKWTMNATTGAHVIPFGTAAGEPVPVTINLTAGNIGDVTASTYHTPVNNLPMPTTPDNVVKITDYYGNNNNANVVDRYWQVDKSGPSGTTSITYTYLDAEIPANGETTMIAQRYDKVTNTWDAPISGQSQSSASNTVTAPGITNFGAMTLVLSNNILPIELVEFKASLLLNKVLLKWTTASESNSDYFQIQRSIDGINFENLKTAKASGNSKNLLKYAILDENPVVGKSYYRLKEIDINGEVSDCGTREIYYYKNRNLQVMAYPNPAHTEFTLLVNKDSDGDATIRVVDYLGRMVYTNQYEILKGENSIDFNCATWSPGVYHIHVTIDEEVIDKTLVVY